MERVVKNKENYDTLKDIKSKLEILDIIIDDLVSLKKDYESLKEKIQTDRILRSNMTMISNIDPHEEYLGI